MKGILRIPNEETVPGKNPDGFKENLRESMGNLAEGVDVRC